MCTLIVMYTIFSLIWFTVLCILTFLVNNRQSTYMCTIVLYILVHFGCTRVHVSKCTQNHLQTFWFFILVHHHNCTNDTWSFDCFNFFFQTFKSKQLSIWFSKKKNWLCTTTPMLMQLRTYVHIFKCIIKWIKRTKIKSIICVQLLYIC